MFSVAPSSRWHSTSSGFITSMSPDTAMSPALTSAGPVALSWRRLAPSPCMRSAICFTLRTRSVTSSRTPASELNSCSTFSILIEVTAAPCSDESSTRRSALPSVRPKPRSSGSATKVAFRLPSPPFFSRPFGFFSSCQFFALTDTGFPWVGQDGAILPGLEPPPARTRHPESATEAESQIRRGDASTGERHCAGSRSRRGST